MEKGFNLIQQLQQTPKWKEFRTWYNQQKYIIALEHSNDESMFIEINFEFQKGVFEKFIESKGCVVTCFPNDSDVLIYGLYWKGYVVEICHTSFEELLIWYFNN